jgi:glycosyltransferase involved in cell wall biosynthesis
MSVLRSIDRTAFQFDFAVHTRQPAAFDAEARELGARILPLNPPRQVPFGYGRQFARLLAQEGPFDVVHSHVHFFSGNVLRIAAGCRVPGRVVQSHTTEIAGSSLPRRAYGVLSRHWMKHYATAGIAFTPEAAAALFGANWQSDPRWQLIPFGLDFSRFAELPPKQELRARLGIPPQRSVVGQVGRLVDVKNHEFTVRVLQNLAQRSVDAHLLVVGGGPLDQAIRDQLRDLNLTDRATLVGDQADVAPFVGAMDCMVFPSFYEGFGIVVLEAQAAGVPVVISDRVPKQMAVVPGMVTRLPLEGGPNPWVEAVIYHCQNADWNSTECYTTIAESQFSIRRCLESLCPIYRSTGNPSQRTDEACTAPTAVKVDAAQS